MLVDGLDIVLDLTRSGGSYLVDAITGRRYLDMFTFVASSALGMNPPALVDDREFHAELMQAALNKPSNSDVYSVAMARFVETFARVLGDPALPHLFFVEGAPWRWRTRSKPRSTGRVGTTKPMGSTRRWALKCSTCAGHFTAAAAIPCR